MNTYRVKISGRVTGVGFRYYALNATKEYSGVSGYIRNIGYGEVEALLQGEQDEIDAILALLRQGPPLARVDSFVINREPANNNLRGFVVK
jgi:acylphosphatase